MDPTAELIERMRERAKVVGVFDAVNLLTEAADVLERIAKERDALVEDRARFPDRPDGVGRMIEAHIGNLRAGKDAANQHASDAYNKLARLRAAAQDVLEHRIGEFPRKGWLRDNDASRAALARLAEAAS